MSRIFEKTIEDCCLVTEMFFLTLTGKEFELVKGEENIISIFIGVASANRCGSGIV